VKHGPTLREKHRLRMFKNRLLRIFGLKMGEMVECWRRLQNEKLHDMYASQNC
jgi:hypothetical protein